MNPEPDRRSATSVDVKCLTEAQLHGLLGDELSPDAETLQQHLGECESCQAQFHRLAAGSAWDEIEHYLDISADRAATSDETLPNRGCQETRSRQAAPILAPSHQPFPKLAGYEVVRELGRGGMGVVYLARELELDRLVAIKMLLHGALSGPDRMTRFRTEAHAIARLSHPNVIQIHHVGEYQNVPFLVLEYVDGPTLRQVINGRAQPCLASAALVTALARAVNEAHRHGIIHRDLKPANVLLNLHEFRKAMGSADLPDVAELLHHAQWSHIQPKLTDFGVAKETESEYFTRSGDVLGTPQYLAPEVVLGRNADALADVYALGVILYELLAGSPPFLGDSVLQMVERIRHEEPKALPGTIPRDLGIICRKCLAKDPAKRYAHADLLAEDLERYMGGRPIMARPTPSWERLLKWAKRRPSVAALSVVSLVAVLATLAIWAKFTRDLTVANRTAVESSQEALQQASIASRNLDQARRGLRHYLNQVRTDARLDTAGLLPLRLQLLKEAVAIYDELVPADADAGLRWEIARVHMELGRLTPRSADTEAIAHYERAASWLEEILNTPPDGAQGNHIRQNLTTCYQSLGTLLGRRGSVDQALDHLRQARDVHRQLLLAEPTSGTHPWGLTVNYQRTGMILRSASRFEEAEQALRKGIEAGSGNAHIADYLLSLGGCHRELGALLLNVERYSEAEEQLQQAVFVGRLLLAVATPAHSRHKSHLGPSLGLLAKAELALEKEEEAQRTMLEAVALRRWMLVNWPDNQYYRAALVAALEQLQATYQKTNAEHLQSVVEQLANLQRPDYVVTPNERDVMRGQVESHIGVGTREMIALKHESAIDQFRQALVLLDSLESPSPDFVDDYLRNVAHARLAELFEWQAAHTESVRHATQSLTAAFVPIKWRIQQARALTRTGQALEAVQIADTLVEEAFWPSENDMRTAWRPHLRMSPNQAVDLAQVLLMSGASLKGAHGDAAVDRAFELINRVESAGPLTEAHTTDTRLVFYATASNLAQQPGGGWLGEQRQADHLADATQLLIRRYPNGDEMPSRDRIRLRTHPDLRSLAGVPDFDSRAGQPGTKVPRVD